jgi:hypothetical protein
VKRFSIGDNLFVLLIVAIILAYILIDEYLDPGDKLEDSCLAAGACEFTEDEDGDIVVRVKETTDDAG